MGNRFLLMMVRHMLNKQGFTLIETLFAVSIMMVIYLFSINIRPYNISQETIVNDLCLFLLEAKTNAMVYKEKVNIEFNNNEVCVNSRHLNRKYRIDNGFFNDHQFSYNKQGHIVNPKTVTLYFNETKYRFVYQIASGAFYVE